MRPMDQFGNEYFDLEENETASVRGGHFPGLLLPPLMVIIVGFLISLISSGITINQSVNAGSDDYNNNLSSTINNGETAGLDYVLYNNGNWMAGFTPEVQYWQSEIERWSEMTGLDRVMIATVMQIESCGDPDATSWAGAMGLFQVMPFHFLSTDDPYLPETNAIRGLAYLQKALQASNGDTRLAFAGYNGGISVMNHPENSWAAETQRYAYWADGIYNEVLSGNGSSARLQEWLGNGGASLCRQAAGRLRLNP